ncbi:uncharacterized protein BCR38DRAFT_331429 [Pseudomassariella vexata]|uniref:N-acetyltransferase domain-containing protein n=1 Tax=Pseudomassariella vexata TaxID=1141098 RepID=A0A1Y2EJI1_9PEZI|nr:uncharacterized protein BCR38DRAFT_331429 [Pseudomassariella vexata]ORY71464.1 hypothetical protein BCR38DRAFT_331429 [Pseudomassariella vexata]
MEATPALTGGPMTDEVLKRIFASDQDMYPAPLTLDQLRSWVTGCPDLSRCFCLTERTENDGHLAGTIMVLPIVGRFWHALLQGKLTEADIDATTMFPSGNGGEEEVGLHVFHVERFDDSLSGFTRVALSAVKETARSKGWTIAGCSALTATPGGWRSFEKLGFVKTGYEEIWIVRDEIVTLVTTFPGEDNNKDGQAKSGVIGKARMVVRFSKG